MDRLKTDEGETFKPDVLLGDRRKVTAKVLAHERGPKILIGKYRKRTGYKRHNGFRAATSRVEISLGGAEEGRREEGGSTKTEAAAPKTAAPKRGRRWPSGRTAADDHVKGMPRGLRGADGRRVTDGAKTWNRPMLEAALEYEQAHAARKGAISALESALKAKEEDA